MNGQNVSESIHGWYGHEQAYRMLEGALWPQIMQIGGVRCAISQIWSKCREMLGENPTDIHL